MRNNNATFCQHFKVFIRYMIVPLLVLIVGFIVAYYNSNNILELIVNIGKDSGYEFALYSPHEVIICQIRVSISIAIIPAIVALVLAIIFFVSDSILVRVGSIAITMIGLMLFIAGTVFSWKIVIPFILSFFYKSSEAIGLKQQVVFEQFISLISTMIIVFGMVAELPVISIILSRIGILTYKRMKSMLSIFVVVAFIFGAIVTPPDVISQSIVAIPIVAVYIISMIICKVTERKM